MNDLFATWHHSRSDVVDHLSQAHCQLVGIRGLEAALAMVDTALAQVSAWFDPKPPQRRPDANRSEQGCDTTAAPVGSFG